MAGQVKSAAVVSAVRERLSHVCQPLLPERLFHKVILIEITKTGNSTHKFHTPFLYCPILHGSVKLSTVYAKIQREMFREKLSFRLFWQEGAAFCPVAACFLPHTIKTSMSCEQCHR